MTSDSDSDLDLIRRVQGAMRDFNDAARVLSRRGYEIDLDTVEVDNFGLPSFPRLSVRVLKEVRA